MRLGATLPPAPLPKRLARARLLVLAASYALLLTIYLRTGLSLHLTSLAALIAWGLQALPLLVLLPGLHRARPRAYAWLGFVIQLAFIHGVLLAFNPERFAPGLVQIALSVIVFAGLIAFLRGWRREFGSGP